MPRPRIRFALGRVLLVGLCLAVCAALSTGPPSVSAQESAAAAPRGPNVVLFLADDMRKDDLAHLPAVRRLLGAQGTEFSNAFSSNALCCPARATLLTGLHAHNHRTMANQPEFQGGWPQFKRHNDVRNLLPRWLQRRSYRTFYMGKYLNGFTGGAQPGWDYWQAPVREIYDYQRWTAVEKQPGRPERVRRYLDGKHYQETVLRNTVRRYVGRWSESRAPFFLWAGSLAPHNAVSRGQVGPPVPERKYRDLRVPPLPRTAAFNEQDVSDKPVWVRWLSLKSPARMRRLHRQRIRALRSVDDTVASTVGALRRQGELDNTILVFTSDNGFLLGEHRMAGKSVGYQEAVRIPLLVRGPGFRPGATVTQAVSLVDVAATIAAAAGVPVDQLDGVPLTGFDTDPSLHRHRPVLVEGSPSEIPRRNQLATDRLGRFYWGAVTGDWTYVQYAEQSGRDMRSEFYDRAQPGGDTQVDNLWDPDADPASPQRRLARWATAHRNCDRAACQEPLGP